MCSIMYPKVYSDYLNRLKSQGHYVRYLDTPQYLHGMIAGETTTLTPPQDYTSSSINSHTFTSLNNTTSDGIVIKCDRISAVKNKMRTVTFTISATTAITGNSINDTYNVTVKNASAEFEFTGPMADTSEPLQLGSPMPGVVEKLLVKKGDTVVSGDVIAVISAMKMEVKVTVPDLKDDKITVKSLSINTGDQVVEGALVAILDTK